MNNIDLIKEHQTSIVEIFEEWRSKWVDASAETSTQDHQNLFPYGDLAVEQALSNLLQRYCDQGNFLITHDEQSLHKLFRESVVVNDGSDENHEKLVDMCIWELLCVCNLFWKVKSRYSTIEGG